VKLDPYAQLASGERRRAGPALRQVVDLPLRRAGVSSKDPAGPREKLPRAGSTASWRRPTGMAACMAEQGELTAELAAKRHERRHACRHAGTVTFLKTTPNFLLLVAYSSHLSSIPAPVGLPIHPSGTVIFVFRESTTALHRHHTCIHAWSSSFDPLCVCVVPEAMVERCTVARSRRRRMYCG